jgi:hypothetical protein
VGKKWKERKQGRERREKGIEEGRREKGGRRKEGRNEMLTFIILFLKITSST